MFRKFSPTIRTSLATAYIIGMGLASPHDYTLKPKQYQGREARRAAEVPRSLKETEAGLKSIETDLKLIDRDVMAMTYDVRYLTREIKNMAQDVRALSGMFETGVKSVMEDLRRTPARNE